MVKGMKNLIIYRWITALIGMIFIIGLYSCSRPLELKILNSGNESFASLEINNPYGNNIVIAPSDTLGAVGFILNGKRNWIKGQPEITRQTDSRLKYEWKHGHLSVIMEVETLENELEFSFKLSDSELKPSAWMINT